MAATPSMVGTTSYETLLVRTSQAQVCLIRHQVSEQIHDNTRIHPWVLDSYLPFSVLDYAPVLGPGEPARTRLSLLLLIEHTDDARCITAMWDFWYTPYSKVSVGRLRR
jgi:hypothetical protein